MYNPRNKTISILLAAAWTAGFCVLTHSAQAKTVSVKDIVRQDIGHTEVLLTTDTIPPKLIENTIPTTYTSLPLFLSKTNLNNLPEDNSVTRADIGAVYQWTQDQLKTHTKPAEDARMNIVEGRVTDFNPGQNGYYPDAHATTLALIRNLQTDTLNTPVVAVSIPPSLGLDKTNTLGINTLLSGGLSDFSGSSKNRKANIEAGSKKIRGVLVPPGETLSFNEYLGDVTAEDGFKPEIVIKADGLKPELGGGICQVSSTLFRAVMQSGMPITTRRNHAFSVNHYFPPGTDATVYSPYTDFKFVNDTPATVLIWNYYKDDHTLAFDLYGTEDDRVVKVDEPLQWDRKVDGSLKASWTRHVIKGGIQRDDVFKSNYLSPALFKKEETFVVSTPPANTSPPTTPQSTSNPFPPATN